MIDSILSSPLASLPLADLDAACRRETKRYQRGEKSDQRFCLEIFHRALHQVLSKYQSAPDMQGQPIAKPSGSVPHYPDEAARNLLVEIYSEFIKALIHRSAIPPGSLDDLVNQVWLHFWQAANNGLRFDSLESALAYLKQTTVSTLIRQRRRARRLTREESLQHYADQIGEGLFADTNADLFEQHSKQRFTERCRVVLSNALEYRVFWMRYGLGFPPRTIAAQLTRENVLLSGKAATARAVSDLLERSCKRLCQDEEIRDLLQGD